MSTKLQHEFGLAVCTAAQIARPNPEIPNGCCVPTNWETCSFPTDLGRSGRIASTEKSSGKQRTRTVDGDAGYIPAEQTVNLNTTPTAMDPGDVVQALARPSAVSEMLESLLFALLRQ